MPFIEQRYRPKIDWYIMDAEKGSFSEAITGLTDTLKDRDIIPADYFNGALNYTCTQLYRKCSPQCARTLSHMLINYFYLSEPRYVKLEDALGMITGMITLFESGEITSRVALTPVIVASLGELLDLVKISYVAYEKRAKAKNGDLT